MWQKELDLTLNKMGIKIENLPSPAELAQLEADIQLSLKQPTNPQAGGIDLGDAYMVRQLSKASVTLAMQYLVYRRKKQQELDEQKSALLQQQNTEAQIQSAQAAEQMRQQTLQLEAQLKVQTEAQLIQLQTQKMTTEYGLKMQLEQEKQKGLAMLEDLKGEIKEDLMNNEIGMLGAKTKFRSSIIAESKEEMQSEDAKVDSKPAAA